jgi:hypothetical protein
MTVANDEARGGFAAPGMPEKPAQPDPRPAQLEVDERGPLGRINLNDRRHSGFLKGFCWCWLNRHCCLRKC